MEVKLYDETYKINRIELNRYTADNALAIQLYCIDKDYGFEEPFATLTVCLGLDKIIKPNDNRSFLDTNNCSWSEEFVEKYNLGKPTGFNGVSGYCTYPLYEWNIEELKKYTK